MKISESRILITGGARGIGNYLALNLAPHARTVFILDNQDQELGNIPLIDNVVKFHCDVTNADEVDATVSSIFQKNGGVNVLINNAGIIHNELLINLVSRPDRRHKIANWKKVIDVNLNSVFYMTSAVVDQMISAKEKGLIINISSISANGNVGQSAYSASKAAVEALTKTWSKELGMFKIRCACIAPGFFDTPSTRQNLSESMLAKWEKGVPLARLGNLDELLSAAEFLIENDYFNGKVLSLDGGLTL